MVILRMNAFLWRDCMNSIIGIDVIFKSYLDLCAKMMMPLSHKWVNIMKMIVKYKISSSVVSYTYV